MGGRSDLPAKVPFSPESCSKEGVSSTPMLLFTPGQSIKFSRRRELTSPRSLVATVRARREQRKVVTN